MKSIVPNNNIPLRTHGAHGAPWFLPTGNYYRTCGTVVVEVKLGRTDDKISAKVPSLSLLFCGVITTHDDLYSVFYSQCVLA